MVGKEFYKDMKHSEKDVARYLNQLNLDWYYEHPVFIYDEKQRPRVWTPDFYLPNLKIHIEVCGSENFDYDYRKKNYEENNGNVVFVHHYKDHGEWKSWLKKQILDIEKHRHNRVMTIIEKIVLKIE